MNLTRSASLARLGRVALATGIVALAGLSLAGCSNGSGNTSGGNSGGQSQVIAPVVVNLDNIDGTKVSVGLNNVVDLNAGDTDVTEWTGTVKDSKIARWVPGKDDGSAQFNPGLEPLAAGTTEVTVTDTATNTSQTFTLVVTD